MRRADHSSTNHPLLAARVSRGWSQDALAFKIRNTSAGRGSYLATTKKTVARWEHGVIPDRLAQVTIAEIFEIPEHLLLSQPWPEWLNTDRTPDVDAATWDAEGAVKALGSAAEGAVVDRRTVVSRLGPALFLPLFESFADNNCDLAPTLGPGSIGKEVPNSFRAILTHLRDLGDQIGGGAIQASVLSNLELAMSVIRNNSCTAETVKDLYRVAAGFAQLAGFNAVDMGLQSAAQNLYVAALRGAAAGQDHELNTYPLSWMSYQAYSTGNGADAFGLAEIALSRSRKRLASPGTRSLLLARGALGAASSRDSRQFTRMVQIAEKLKNRDNDPILTSWFNDVEMRGIVARGMLDLGDYQSAEGLLREILNDPRMADNPRSEAVYRVRLATALAKQRRADESFAQAAEAASVAERLHSRRTVEMLREVVVVLRGFDQRRAMSLLTRISAYDKKL